MRITVIIKQKYIFCIFVLLLFQHPALAQTSRVAQLTKELKPGIADTTRLRVMVQLAGAYASVDQEKKFYYALQYKELAERLQVDTLVCEAYIDMGGSYAIRSIIDSSLFYFNKGYDKAKSIGYERGMARSLASIAFVYDKVDNFEQAIEKCKAALVIYKKIGYKKGINQCYINIGGMFFDLAQYSTAEPYFMEAYKNYTAMGFEPGIGSALFSLGNVNKRLKRYEASENYYKKSLEVRERIGDINGIALARWGLGTLDIEKGNYQKALENLKIARQYDIELQNRFHECTVLLSMGEAYLGLKDFGKAYEHVDIVYKNSLEMDAQGLRLLALKILISIAKAENDIPKAFEFQNHYVALNDSVQTESAIRTMMLSEFQRVRSENDGLLKDNESIASKNTEYISIIVVTSIALVLVVLLLLLYYKRNHEKKVTNDLLQKQKLEIANINEELMTQMEVISKQNNELEKLNNVKNKFFSIVSHDLRSPLATLKMLFGLYRDGQLNAAEMNELLFRLEDTIYTTSEFLDNLLEWSKSQLDGMIVQPVAFDIKTLVSQNLQLMDSQINLKDLKVSNLVNAQTLVYADSNMIHVVIRNLISNAIKFCQTNDAIVINAKVTEEQVTLTIADTGPGISDENIQKLFSLEHTITTGSSGETGHQIGLILCKDMMAQNNGDLYVESKVNCGTTFTLVLPRAH